MLGKKEEVISFSTWPHCLHEDKIKIVFDSSIQTIIFNLSGMSAYYILHRYIYINKLNWNVHYTLFCKLTFQLINIYLNYYSSKL